MKIKNNKFHGNTDGTPIPYPDRLKKPTLPRAIKRKWIRELRSGKWIQGTGRLASGVRERCCLGVLAECADPKRQTWESIDTLFGRHLGLPGWFISGLVDLNDGHLEDDNSFDYPFADFNEIADLIEAVVEEK